MGRRRPVGGTTNRSDHGRLPRISRVGLRAASRSRVEREGHSQPQNRRIDQGNEGLARYRPYNHVIVGTHPCSHHRPEDTDALRGSNKESERKRTQPRGSTRSPSLLLATTAINHVSGQSVGLGSWTPCPGAAIDEGHSGRCRDLRKPVGNVGLPKVSLIAGAVS